MNPTRAIAFRGRVRVCATRAPKSPKIVDARNLKRRTICGAICIIAIRVIAISIISIAMRDLPIIPYSDSDPDIIDQLHTEPPLIATCNLRAHLAAATNRYTDSSADIKGGSSGTREILPAPLSTFDR